jgi:SAM-dependent methyltransferase
MRLNWLALHWERLARRDPFFAVLTDVEERFGGRDLDAFYQSGREEISAVLRRAEERGLRVPRERALDFGCGVGRLTLALAEQFVTCDGVDISASMLAVARKHNRRPDRCAFHQNRAEDLSLFDDAIFSFVYSTLVLQHMAPGLSVSYLKEMIRVLAADGLLVFQLPSHREAREPLAGDIRTAVTGPLSTTAFHAGISTEAATLSGRCGEPLELRVSVENRSTTVWPALPDARGRHRLNVANHWLDEHGRVVDRDDTRSPLPFDLEPGARVEVLLFVRPPRVNGRYLLEIDLVQEDVCWFAERGSRPLRIPCDVTGGADPPMRDETMTSRANQTAPERFSARHPGLFATLRATGLRDAYWSTRRAIDVVKSRRDSAIRRWLHPVVHDAIHPFIRRRVHPLINWWNGVSLSARMEMHCVPRSEVAAAVTESGGRIVDVEEEAMAGGYNSCRYWVIRQETLGDRR